MAKYVNSQTGILIETDCVIEGEFWEEVIEVTKEPKEDKKTTAKKQPRK